MERRFVGTFVSAAVLILALMTSAVSVQAQQTGTSSAAAELQATIPDTAVQDDGPVPVPEPTAKALQYYRSGNLIWVLTTIWGLLIPLLFLFSGLSARIRDVAQRLGRRWFFVIAIYSIIFTLLTFLIDLPLSYYTEFVRPHAYDLSNQTISKWFTDTLKGLAIGLIMTPLIMWIPFLLLKKSPRRWWLYTGLAAIPLTVLLLLVSPIWIDPMFNKFGPMKNQALEQKILSLADRAGIEGGRVFEVAKSEDTKTVNAYVSGFASTKRIVLWDTIIAKLDEDELLFVMGHEMGHFVLKHVAQIILVSSAVIIAGLFFVHRFGGLLIARFRNRFRFDELSDIAALPLILFLFGLASILFTPALLAMSRHNEHEADRFGLEITRKNRPAAEAFVKLQQENLAVPRPGLLFKLWRSSHPPIGERVDFINGYKPWAEGKALVYENRFKATGSGVP